MTAAAKSGWGDGGLSCFGNALILSLELISTLWSNGTQSLSFSSDTIDLPTQATVSCCLIVMLGIALARPTLLVEK
eukprot:11135956-Ditylum_brightwellii.AAC.1